MPQPPLPPHEAAYDVLGVGGILMDRLLHVDEDFIKRLSGEKGGADTVDLNTLEALIQATNSKERLVPGGATANTIKGMAQLGQRCALMGMAGRDQYRDHYLKHLERLGIRSLIQTGQGPSGQVLCLITPDGERTQRPFPGASTQLTVEHVEPLHVHPARLVVVEAFALRNPGLMTRLGELAKAEEALLAVGAASFETIRLFREEFVHCLEQGYVDILFANEDEAFELTGLAPQDALRSLSQYCPITVVTLGADGCLVKSAEEEFHHPIEAVQAVDTTGAGDLFAAGFLDGILRNWTLKECATQACRLGSLVTQYVGPELPDEAWASIVH